MRWGDFKPKLADALVAHLEPIQVCGRGSRAVRWVASRCALLSYCRKRLYWKLRGVCCLMQGCWQRHAPHIGKVQLPEDNPCQIPELIGCLPHPCPTLSTLLQTKYKELMADPTYIDGILEEGADVANETAQQTLNACKDAMGFVVPRRRS